jgi:competence protein ComEC
MSKKLYYLVGLLIGFVVMVVTQLPSDKARMVVCDVGQGDAILIIKGRYQVLIDGGPSREKILSCLEEQIPFYDRAIELIVLTNTDNDHMNGLSAVVERYQVIQFVTSDGVHSSDALVRLRGVLTTAGIVPVPVEQGDQIRIGDTNGLQFNVLWPPDTNEEYVAVIGSEIDKSKREQILGASAKRGNLNERSVVLLLLEDNKKILLSGDTGDQAESEMLKEGVLQDIDILKVGHHGSKYASTTKFLDMIKPELAVISVGSKNTYGHPTSEALERLSKIGAVVRRTDEEGSIVLEL